MRFAPWGLLLCLSWALPAQATTLDLSIEIPRLDVAQYHRPYVAAWIENDSRKVAANLLVWYQQDRPGEADGAEKGSKWLPDLRQWWRRSGRALAMPVDGVSAATRPVGAHSVSFQLGQADLALEPGAYKLRVEAAREEGGRELIDIPFSWPINAPQTINAQGHSELGAISLTFAP
ncbi:periplasmic protein [Oceanococcus atlanticus]|uniref:Periplasmic protein n=1 Tax=Oceanococcus atlanticus TaxID=1317117 RepID=A0A1Y1SFG6_9GAMM|nr:DUF2271 domain-containing protein [Oceanococcus atlanticus]ORE88404.1 periplasmic protein [Oceanococcus atlanticus]RZO85518.1 MAG: DUF2271 domain-containing protein [Oceanococcus sp.]